MHDVIGQALVLAAGEPAPPRTSPLATKPAIPKGARRTSRRGAGTEGVAQEGDQRSADGVGRHCGEELKSEAGMERSLDGALAALRGLHLCCWADGLRTVQVQPVIFHS